MVHKKKTLQRLQKKSFPNNMAELRTLPVEKPPPAPASITKVQLPAERKPSGGSLDRDIALADVEKEKNFSFIKAWEDSEKTKADNKAQKKKSEVSSWENSKKAALGAKLKRKEEQLERKKAEYAEKIHNKTGLVHKEADEKRATVEAKRREEILKVEEMAEKYRETGQTPKKFLGLF